MHYISGYSLTPLRFNTLVPTKSLQVDYKKPTLSAEALGRITRLKTKSLQVKQLVCPERARYLTQVYRENLCDPMIIKRAKALQRIFSHMSVWTGDEELIVGNQASSLRAAPIFPEYTVQ